MAGNPPPSGSPNWTRLLWFAAIWILILYLFGIFSPATARLEIAYSDFKEQVEQGNITSVKVEGMDITGSFAQPVNSDLKTARANDSTENGAPEPAGDQEEDKAPEADGEQFSEFRTTVPSFGDEELMGLLEREQVTIRAESEERSWVATLLIALLPWVLIIGFFIYTSKKLQERMGGGGLGSKGGPFSFGKSKAKLYEKSSSGVTFKDVAGLGNAKKELEEVVGFLKEPAKYQALGAELPRGVLLAGPPGTGKTLMARGVAGEAGVPFFSISGSEFIEMFVGVGASRVRDMFSNAKKDAPSIIFIDELDAIGRTRGAGVGGGHDEREQTLNQILSEMDGFAKHESVVVLAATNRPDVLDPALIRPGRFDRQVTLDLPQRKAREEILNLHTKEVPIAEDVDLGVVAERTVGFSGADLKNLVNEAALLAARKDKHKVEMDDFDQGRDKIIMGVIREDLVSDQEKKAIAIHEAGHALMARLMPGADPLKKVTIIPRGRALGATEQIPEEDRHNLSRTYLLNRIAIMLGGRAAEKVIYNETTTGAGDDLKKASQLARRMVTQWGMSETVGPVTFRQGETHPFLGREMAEPRDFSEHTARLIDDEVMRISREMEQKTIEMLTSHREDLEAVANLLYEQETITNEDIEQLLGREA